MTTFLTLTIVGIVVGCIYALSATGLVVTYITSGIFNFAHGAVGMVAAFTYWRLVVDEGWPAIIALPFILFVFAPALGALIDLLIMRNLHNASEEVRVIVTVALMLFLLGLGFLIWDPGVPRTLPRYFGGDHVRLFGLNILYHQIIVVIAAIAVAVGLRLFLFRTRIGVALRAVVDAPDLASYFGAAPGRVRLLGWAMGSSLAALAGVLLAPLVTLDILLLTFLVINGYAAAVAGRLRSLPLTFAGGVALGLLESYVVGYAPGNFLSYLRPTVPIIFLYILLLIFPHSRLRVGRAFARRARTVPSLRSSLISAALFVGASVIVVNVLTGTNLFGQGGALKVGRVLVQGDTGYIMLIAVVFAAAAVGVLAVRRSSFGRRLMAMSDSQVACATLGMSVTWTKLIVFGASAALAGLAGVFFGGLQGSDGSANFNVLNSLALFLLLAIWGVDSIIAVFFAGLSFAYLSVLQAHFPDVRGLPYLLTGLGALGLARNPNGVVAQVSDNWERVKAWWRGRERAPA